ncbi:putative pre-mRNA-splicing factor ATP-dependent RNA helicase [Symbiodinium microadriaticum]|uniref:RNA helicase n=1 Tax=Symbiodinium microadriaticum TaxID=2951 RepID=A0A1Q9DQ33_SYMMI|nr:putative pre-mRNA-splicing factor ATP-dependent RNA helicase [Symbiodinium microadriaticum]
MVLNSGPSPESMMRALEMLHFLGAIDDEGDLTETGAKMADFPVDPHLSRTVIAGAERRCLSEVLAIIAMLSVPPPFSRPRYAQKAADKAHKYFASGYGDHLSLLNAYQAYTSASSKAEFCRDNYLSDRNMKQAENVRRQLAGIARNAGLHDEEGSDMLTLSIRKAFIEGFFMQCAHLDETGKHYLTVRDQQMADAAWYGSFSISRNGLEFQTEALRPTAIDCYGGGIHFVTESGVILQHEVQRMAMAEGAF